MSLRKNLAANLKRLRSASGLAFEDFYKLTGVAKSTLQNLEAGKNSTLDTISAIEHNLLLPTGSLLLKADDANLNILTNAGALISIVFSIVKNSDYWNMDKQILLRFISTMDEIMSAKK